MKKFRFTLQTVHNVREMLQEKESLILNELRTDADQAAAHVAKIEKTRRDAIEKYSARLNAGEQLNPVEMELNLNHFASLNTLRLEGEKIVVQKNEACRRQSEAVAAAMRQVKVTGRLRDNQEDRHRLEFSRWEQGNIDEIVSTSFARQKMANK